MSDSIDFNRFPAHLTEQVRALGAPKLSYLPCAVRLKDGRTFPYVYLVTKEHKESWTDGSGTVWLSIDDVEKIDPSPGRLPSAIYDKLSANWPKLDGLDRPLFTLVFNDGSKETYAGFGDFIAYPEGKNAGDIQQVLAEGEDSIFTKHFEPYVFCFY